MVDNRTVQALGMADAYAYAGGRMSTAGNALFITTSAGPRAGRDNHQRGGMDCSGSRLRLLRPIRLTTPCRKRDLADP